MKKVWIRWIFILFLFMSTSLAAYGNTIRLPIIMGNKISPKTMSRYMYTINQDSLRNMGKDSGVRRESGVIVLFFGSPRHDPTLPGEKFGTRLPDENRFVTIGEIELGVKSWIEGYWYNTPINGPRITIVPATTNLYTNIGYTHSLRWATMINNLKTFIDSRSYGAQISVMGGINLELNFGKPTATRTYVDGYASITNISFLNIGSCEGCPRDTNPTAIPDNEWTLEDIWYVSWGNVRAYPLPQIYAENGVSAAQWQFLANWAWQNRQQSNIDYKGVITQFQACIDRNDPCSGTKNSPEQGWQQFYDKLQSSPNTAQPILNWLTDVSWRQDF